MHPRSVISAGILLLLFIMQLHAQEVHFSQFYNNPLLINPALAGNFDGSLRLGAAYRNQGAAISVPYTTYSAWGDAHLEPERLQRSAIGTGVYLYNDNAGDGGLSTTAGTFAASFIRGFNRDNRFKAALGFSVGILNRKINFSKLVFDNQWNGTVFDPNVASGEPFSSSSIFAPDFNFGGVVFWKINEKIKTNIGLAMHHINRPKLTFYDDENRLEQKIVAHAQVFVQVDEIFEIRPAVFFATQRGTNELLAGADLFISRGSVALIAGLWYRLERDIIPGVGIIHNGLAIQFSFDVNVSRLHLASNYRGGMEITLVKTLSLNANRKPCHEF
jgi:type IX secretion system PorP/SprF family membrane protein